MCTFTYVTGGVNSKKGCFGRNTKFFRESEDFAGNRETCENLRETQSNKVEFLGRCPKILGPYSDLREDFYLHMALVKRRLLELSPHLYVHFSTTNDVGRYGADKIMLTAIPTRFILYLY